MKKPSWIIDYVGQAWKLHTVWLSSTFAVIATAIGVWQSLAPKDQATITALVPAAALPFIVAVAHVAVIALRMVKQPNAMPPQVPSPEPVMLDPDPVRTAQLKAQADAEKPA